MKATWKIFNKIINPNSNKITSIDMLTINQISVTNIEEISKKLEYYFFIVGGNIGNSIISSPVDYKSCMTGSYRESFFLFQTHFSWSYESFIQIIWNSPNMQMTGLFTIKDMQTHPPSSLKSCQIVKTSWKMWNVLKRVGKII